MYVSESSTFLIKFEVSKRHPIQTSVCKNKKNWNVEVWSIDDIYQQLERRHIGCQERVFLFPVELCEV